MRKLRTTSQAVSAAELKRMKECVTFKAGGFQAPLDSAIFETVIDALMREEELEFDYQTLEARRAGSPKIKSAKGAAAYGTEFQVDEVGRRRVQPFHALCWDYAWYLFAYDYARKDIRTFAIGRMLNAVNTGKQFEPARSFDLEAELEKSFGIRRGGKVENVHLRFYPSAVPLVIERLWHPSQELTIFPDKSLEMTMRVAICPELIRWVRGWGPDVEVLAPSSLDSVVVNGARTIVRRAESRG